MTVIKQTYLSKIKKGVFKYIQVTITDVSNLETINVVRGFLKYEYHKEEYKDLLGI